MDATDEQLDEALELFLSTDPGVFVAALDEGGYRCEPTGALEVFERFTPLPALGPGQKMLDVVVQADRGAALDIWRRALQDRIAVGAVCRAVDPKRYVFLMAVSMRHRGQPWLVAYADCRNDPIGMDRLRRVWELRPRRKPRTATMTKNLHGMISAVDEQTCLLTGWRPEDLIGTRSIETIHPDDHDRVMAAWLEMLFERFGERVHFRQLCADGNWLWVQAENELHEGENSEIVVTTYLSNISDQVAENDALARRERHFRTLAEALPSGVIETDAAGSVLYANARAVEILGLALSDSLADYLQWLTEPDRCQVQAELALVLADRQRRELEVGVRLTSGSPNWCLISITAFGEDQNDSVGAVLSLVDITEIVRLRNALTVQATIDPLTGCNNRASTMEILDRALASENSLTTIVVFIDLDKFKPINDEFGHAAGDEFLLEAARRLRAAVRSNDTVGRIGGDEFLIVCQRVARDDEVTALAVRIKADLERDDVAISGTTVPMRASIGIAVAEEDICAEELVALADAAMYESKRVAAGTPVRLHRGEMSQLTT